MHKVATDRAVGKLQPGEGDHWRELNAVARAYGRAVKDGDSDIASAAMQTIVALHRDVVSIRQAADRRERVLGRMHERQSRPSWLAWLARRSTRRAPRRMGAPKPAARGGDAPSSDDPAPSSDDSPRLDKIARILLAALNGATVRP